MLLGITMGDAAGVGPEIVLKAFATHAIESPFVLFGDLSALSLCNERLSLGVTFNAVDSARKARAGLFNVIDTRQLTRGSFSIGTLSSAAGAASMVYVDRSLDAIKHGDIDAIVTLPVNKKAVRQTIPGFSGHTGYIADAFGVSGYTMTLVSEKLVVTHVTTHVSLRTAIDLLDTDKIVSVIRTTAELCSRLQRGGRIAVMGLNPHAGENGAFGDEESTIIGPAIERCRQQGYVLAGPLPPDTVFMRAFKGEFDAVVCMYHDQGHIPMKTIGLDSTVNVTAGLPIVRTSVDHGTAFDIAYTGKVSIGSFIAACRIAKKLAEAPA